MGRLRLVFMGTPDFAVPTLIELVGRGHDIAAVYTRAAKAGRRAAWSLQPTPVEREARALRPAGAHAGVAEHGEAQAAFAAHEADAAVVVAYGLILPKPILDAPRLGCFNLHASLLPRWRGAAPIQRAIMAGDAETGVTMMHMEEGLDTGPMAMAERVAIGPDMTAGELHDALARLGADLMARALGALERGTLDAHAAAGRTASPMPRRSTRPRRASTGRGRRRTVHDHIRGLSPFPGAWCELDGEKTPVRIKVLRSTRDGEGTSAAPGTVLDDALTIACGDGAVRLIEVQRAGKQPMRREDFLRGTAVKRGTVLK